MVSKNAEMNKRHYLYVCLIVLLVAACSTRPTVPRRFPDEEKMAVIIADVYQTESLLGQTRLSYNSDKEDKVSGYYRFALEQHGLTKAEFDTAMGWYSAHPVVLSDVYEVAVEILSKRDAELRNQMKKEKEESAIAARIPDKQELWEDTTAFVLPTNPIDSLDNRLPFNIGIDSLESGILTLHASYVFKEGSFLDSAQMKMFTLYADSTRDSVSYHIHKSFKKVEGNISYDLEKNKQLLNVEGFLFSHDTTKKSLVEISDVRLTYIPTMESQDMMLK